MINLSFLVITTILQDKMTSWHQITSLKKFKMKYMIFFYPISHFKSSLSLKSPICPNPKCHHCLVLLSTPWVMGLLCTPLSISLPVQPSWVAYVMISNFCHYVSFLHNSYSWFFPTVGWREHERGIPPFFNNPRGLVSSEKNNVAFLIIQLLDDL